MRYCSDNLASLLTQEKIENSYKEKCCKVQSDSYKQMGERKCHLRTLLSEGGWEIREIIKF